MKQAQSMKTVKLLATGCSMLLLIACGAPQPAEVKQVEVAAPVVVERVKTPEELEAERVSEAKAARQAGFDAYADKNDENRLKKAESALRSAVELEPGDANSWFNLGLVMAEQGDTTASSAAFARAQSIDPQFMRGKAYEGYLKLKEGDAAGAEKVFRECIAARENETGCNINLAILQRQKLIAAGKRDAKSAQEAIVFLRFALAGESLSADAYANLARIYFDLGRIELARVVCENAIQLGSDAATLHNRLGLIALAQKDVITAYREFLAAVKRDPDYIDAHMNIGAMALNFRDFEVAKRSFEAVLSKREKDRDARRSYAVALRGLDDGAGAESQYNQLLTEDPNDFATLYNLAILQQELKRDYPKAVETFQRLKSAVGKARFERMEDVDKRIVALQTLIEFGAGEPEAPPEAAPELLDGVAPAPAAEPVVEPAPEVEPAPAAAPEVEPAPAAAPAVEPAPAAAPAVEPAAAEGSGG